MALVPGLREGVAVVPFVFLAVLNELLPRVVAGVDERKEVPVVPWMDGELCVNINWGRGRRARAILAKATMTTR